MMSLQILNFCAMAVLPLQAMAIITPDISVLENRFDFDVMLPDLINQFENDPIVRPHLRTHIDSWLGFSQQLFATNGNNVTGVDDFSCAQINLKRDGADSVHSLTPADISVIAALGDSLTAGMGAGAQKFSEDLYEYRGLSFTIGGDGDVKFMVTLPNIFKQFNSELKGASHRVSPIWYKLYSQLNVAVSGSRAPDLLSQAEDLVQRMKEMEEIDVNRDWKLVTLFVGSNDLCGYCKNESRYSAENYKRNIKNAVDYLQAYLPRTIVNLVSMVDVRTLRQTHATSLMCRLLHLRECPCLRKIDDKDFDSLLKSYRDAVHSLAADLGYFQSDDFTVIASPGIENANVIFNGKNEVDLSLFAPDCFHWSQIGHSLAARPLWNNLMQPFADKDSVFDQRNPFIKLQCPDPKCPFIRTPLNTLNCDFYLDSNKTREERKEFLTKVTSSRQPARPFTMRQQALSLYIPEQPPMRPFPISVDFKNAELARTRPRSTNFSWAGLLVTVTLAVVATAVVAMAVTMNKNKRRINEKTPLLSTSFSQQRVY